MRSLFLAIPLLLATSLACAQDDLGELTQKLADPSPEERERAATALGALGKRATPASAGLIRASADANFKVRCAATKALAELGSPPADKVLARLISLLSDKSAVVQAAAAQALARLKAGGAALDPLSQLLAHKRFRVRAAALAAISSAGENGEPALSAIESLAKSDPSKTVRERAGEAAKAIRAAVAQAEAAETFLGASFHNEAIGLVVTRAHTPLAMAYGLHTGENLVGIDQHQIKTRADLKAVLALYAAGEEIEFRILDWGSYGTEMPRFHTLTAEDWPGLAAQPVTAKPAEDTPRAWAALFAHTKRNADLVAIAAAVKAHLADVLPILVEGAFTPKFKLRGRAAKVLFSALGESAVPGLLALLESDTASDQSQAAQILGTIGPPATKALPRLEVIAKGRGYQVDAALVALCKIAGNTPQAWERIQAQIKNRSDLRWLEAAWAHLGKEHQEKLLEYPRKPEVRELAAKAARSAKNVELVPALFQRLKDEMGDDAAQAVMSALGICPEGDYLAPVLKDLFEILDGKATYSSNANTVIYTLAEIGEPALGPLLAAYANSKSKRFKRNSLSVFARLASKHEAALPPILAQFESEDPKLLKACGVGIGKCTSKKARAALVDVFKRSQPDLLLGVLWSLRTNAILGPEFEKEILAALAHSNQEVRKAATAACATLGFQSALEPLRAQWDALKGKEPSYALLGAVMALGPHRADLARYGQALAWEGSARFLAMRALSGFAAEAAKHLPKVVPLLSDKGSASRVEDFLVRIGEPAIKPLQAALKAAPEGEGRKAIAKALSRLQPK